MLSGWMHGRMGFKSIYFHAYLGLIYVRDRDQGDEVRPICGTGLNIHLTSVIRDENRTQLPRGFLAQNATTEQDPSIQHCNSVKCLLYNVYYG